MSTVLSTLEHFIGVGNSVKVVNDFLGNFGFDCGNLFSCEVWLLIVYTFNHILFLKHLLHLIVLSYKDISFKHSSM